MKLQSMKTEAVARAKAAGLTKQKIEHARKWIIEHHAYSKDPEIRLAYEVINATFGIEERCEMCNRFNATDMQLMSLGKAVIRELEK